MTHKKIIVFLFILSLLIAPLLKINISKAEEMNIQTQNEMDIPEDAVYWAGHYYKAFDQALTPAAAAAQCEAMGGYLATITTSAEYDQIWSLISAKSKGKSAYQLMGIHKGVDGWYCRR